MATLETHVDLHDALVALLQAIDSRALVALLYRVIELPLPAVFTVEEHTPIVELPALGRLRQKRIADSVLVVRGADGQILATFVIEVQLSWKLDKGRDWMIFSVAFASRHDRKARVMIVSPKSRLRARIRELIEQIDEPIDMLELDHLERIDDEDQVRLRPHETILGALHHSNNEDLAEDLRVATVRAALIALQRVDPTDWLRYLGLIMGTAPTHIGERAMELVVESGGLDAERIAENWEFIQGSMLHDWLVRGLRQEGRREGLQEGRADALRLVLRELLTLRDAATPALLERLEDCNDPATLERWFHALASSKPGIPLGDLFT